MSQETIAIIIPYRFVPPQNGGHHAAFGFCEAMSKKYDVVVISTTNNQAAGLPFRLERLFADRFFKYFSPLVAWRLWQFFRKEKIKACMIQQPFFGLLAMPICKLLGVEFIIYSHNIEYQRFKTIGKWWWSLLYPIEWLIYRSADRVFFISPDDLELAIPIFRLTPNKCTVIPYGTRLQEMPIDRAVARQNIIAKHQLKKDNFVILFFGAQSYRPNLEAVERIVFEINPILQEKADFTYQILICGGGLPEKYNRFENVQNIEYLGFVEDIEGYIKASDLMLNPINTGGGIKTKVIESIALGTTVLSSQTGAKGINEAASGEKLITVPDKDVSAFANAIIELRKQDFRATPTGFYKKYNWDKIIEQITE